MYSLKNNEHGVTLIELLLAMTLFTSVMVIATVGFIGMNRVFTRGVIRKELSESSQRINDEVTRSVRNSNTQTTIINCAGEDSSSCQLGVGAVCMDGTRYYWNVPVQSDETSVVGGLYRDAATTCKDAINPSTRTVVVDDRFRIRTFAVSQVSGNSGLYKVSGVLTSGPAESLNNLGGDPFTISCKGSAQTSLVRSCSVEIFKYIVGSRGA